MSNKSSPKNNPRKICRGIVIREKTPGAGDIRLFVNFRGQRRCLDIPDLDEMIAFAHDLAGKMRKKENIWNDPRWDQYQAKEGLPHDRQRLAEIVDENSKDRGFQLEVWDREIGPPLQFIHGVGASGEPGAANLAELAADFRLIVYHRRGYGASSSSPRNCGSNAEYTIALIEKSNTAPAVVAGYSAGATIASNMRDNPRIGNDVGIIHFEILVPAPASCSAISRSQLIRCVEA